MNNMNNDQRNFILSCVNENMDPPASMFYSVSRFEEDRLKAVMDAEEFHIEEAKTGIANALSTSRRIFLVKINGLIYQVETNQEVDEMKNINIREFHDNSFIRLFPLP